MFSILFISVIVGGFGFEYVGIVLSVILKVSSDKKQNEMIDKFLKAKHLQLFTLMFGLPIVFQIIMMGSIFSSINLDENPYPSEFFNIMKFFPIIMILYMGIFFGWF